MFISSLVNKIQNLCASGCKSASVTYGETKNERWKNGWNDYKWLLIGGMVSNFGMCTRFFWWLQFQVSGVKIGCQVLEVTMVQRGIRAEIKTLALIHSLTITNPSRPVTSKSHTSRGGIFWCNSSLDRSFFSWVRGVFGALVDQIAAKI